MLWVCGCSHAFLVTEEVEEGEGRDAQQGSTGVRLLYAAVRKVFREDEGGRGLCRQFADGVIVRNGGIFTVLDLDKDIGEARTLNDDVDSLIF